MIIHHKSMQSSAGCVDWTHRIWCTNIWIEYLALVTTTIIITLTTTKTVWVVVVLTNDRDDAWVERLPKSSTKNDKYFKWLSNRKHNYSKWWTKKYSKWRKMRMDIWMLYNYDIWVRYKDNAMIDLMPSYCILFRMRNSLDRRYRQYYRYCSTSTISHSLRLSVAWLHWSTPVRRGPFADLSTWPPAM